MKGRFKMGELVSKMVIVSIAKWDKTDGESDTILSFYLQPLTYNKEMFCNIILINVILTIILII
jgi:hypothetical protein